MTTKEEIFKQIGITSRKKVDIKPMSIAEAKKSIFQLSHTDIDDIRKLISPRIVDFKVTYEEETCEECGDILEIKFQWINDYNIIGFKNVSHYFNGEKFNLEYAYFDQSAVYREMPVNAFHFARKAGYVYQSLVYSHHTTNCSINEVFKNNLKPMADSLNMPRTGGEDVISFIDWNDGETTDINNITVEKALDWDYFISTEPFFDDEFFNDLLIHPHFFSYMCRGNQDMNPNYTNAVLTRNPLAMIRILILSTDYTYPQDEAGGGFEFFADVFINSKYLFDNLFLDMLTSESKIAKKLWSDLSTEPNHFLNLDCYCVVCVNLKWCMRYRDVRVDDGKLLTNGILHTKEEFVKVINEIAEDEDCENDDSYWGKTIRSRLSSYSMGGTFSNYLLRLMSTREYFKHRVHPVSKYIGLNKLYEGSTYNFGAMLTCDDEIRHVPMSELAIMLRHLSEIVEYNKVFDYEEFITDMDFLTVLESLKEFEGNPLKLLDIYAPDMTYVETLKQFEPFFNGGMR